MLVRHLSLTDFRNYSAAEVALQPGANLFVGSNGQGKTNLVEALGYLSTLGSHRVSSDQALIRSTTQAAIIRARLEHQGREVLVEVQINKSEANRAQVNRSMVKIREIPRFFSSVLFAPEDLALVRGDPSVRRKFLDQLLVARTPRLAGVASDYDRVLRQRNTLLKSARNSGVKANQLSTLEIWDDRLVALGSEIIAERDALVARLRPHVEAAYLAVAGADHSPRLMSRLSILSSNSTDDDTADADEALVATDSPVIRADIESDFRAALVRLRRQELDRGITLCGPHRDDVVFQLNGLPAKGYASHGESWSFALALKIASADLLRVDSTSGDPVVILDDVFAELDQARRTRLAAAVADYEQVLITAAVFDDVPPALAAHTVHISAGTIVDPAADA
ncbi:MULTISPECIES: DNA replication/repair protein RecF [Subtercola]|uniref:DNA replication and repair protein RecF n=1 Tax=Subtercola vilae TaxID=2056433 RepID=A0A4T2C8S2_9MICO|nr:MULTISPECIES: DNA replication/repair protein RecF [Subtercola]MEA9985392.1 DNA replication/repair protein RecF [Subtercola sp. RTI3]TIH40865.1 DNA replication/repair protein RecF [Subtercola vilae]